MTERLALGPDDAGRTLVVSGERVIFFGPAARAPAAARRLDCAGTILGPGRVNAHTHMYSGLAPLGMPAPAPAPANFLEILERVWWRLDRALEARSLRAAVRLYVAEALLHGTTALIDHHESPAFVEGSLDVLAGACEELGVRALLCYGATERNGGREEAGRGLAECRRFARERAGSLLRGAVGLHASFTVSDTTLREAGELARELGTVVHVHLAEDRADVEDARRRGWPGPLERLREFGALPEGSILAHGVHLEPGQVRAAEELGCWIVQNPRSNRTNGVGYPRALGASRRVALGTDGYPADMTQEEAVLREEARLHGERPEEEAVWARQRAEAGRELLAERFGLPFQPLGEGTAGDVCAFQEQGAGRPRHVLVAGRPVVVEGRLRGGDLGAIREEARREAGGLWERMAQLR